MANIFLSMSRLVAHIPPNSTIELLMKLKHERFEDIPFIHTGFVLETAVSSKQPCGPRAFAHNCVYLPWCQSYLLKP